MSEFKCEVFKIGKTWANPNADTLMCTEALGFPVQFKKGSFNTGDLAVYIPIDSLLPLGSPVFSFLKDPKHPERHEHRVKAKKLRGIFSEGMIVPLPVGAKEGENLSGVLGVIKYEEPDDQEIEVAPKSAWRRLTSALNKKIYGKLYGKKSVKAAPFPDYDIESIRKHKNILQLGEEVVITEKIHGQNASYGWYRKEYVGKNPILGLVHRFWGPKFYVRSHKSFKDPDSSNNWTEVANRLDLANKLRPYPGIAIYGEVFGAKVQDLTYYQYGKTLRVFDVYDLNKRRWFDCDEATEFCQKIGLDMVPVLYKGPYKGLDAHTPLAEGLTTIQPPEGISSPCIREGWVIKPLKNRSEDKLGRVIMKFVGQTYLLRHGGTEKH